MRWLVIGACVATAPLQAWAWGQWRQHRNLDRQLREVRSLTGTLEGLLVRMRALTARMQSLSQEETHPGMSCEEAMQALVERAHAITAEERLDA